MRGNVSGGFANALYLIDDIFWASCSHEIQNFFHGPACEHAGHAARFQGSHPLPYRLKDGLAIRHRCNPVLGVNAVGPDYTPPIPRFQNAARSEEGGQAMEVGRPYGRRSGLVR